MSSTILWNGPRLLIPMHVDALVVSQDSLSQVWTIAPMEYTQIGQFTQVMPNLTTETTVQPGKGVTLHWALPDGFKQGVQDDNDEGNVIFPFVPNRWLIIRKAIKSDNTVVMLAWIIQSDYNNLQDGVNLYPNLDDEKTPYTRIGKYTPLSAWERETVAENLFLTATGPGDPGFSGYNANINSVFSFYDALEDLQNTQCKISYSVYGWLTDPASDPLNSWSSEEDWDNSMNLRGWSVGDSNDLDIAKAAAAAWFKDNEITVKSGLQGELAAQTLCHGFVFNVNWLGYNGSLQTGVPGYSGIPPTDQAELPQIAIGNTAIDALSVLAEQELIWENQPAEGVATFLQKFQYNLLDDNLPPSQDFKLAFDTHNAWFGTEYRGKYWIIDDPSSPDPPVVDENLLSQLSNVNKLQQQYDYNSQLFENRQKELYALWWKQGWANDFPPFGPQPPNKEEILNEISSQLNPNAPNSLYTQTLSLQTAQSDALKSLNTAIDQLKQDLPSNLELKPVSNQQPYHSNNPVMMIYGAKRSYKYGADGRFTNDNLLFTRFTGQCLYGIKVTTSDGKSINIDPSNIDIPYPDDFKNNSNIPEDVLLMCEDLWVENFFLDTNNATLIASKALELLDDNSESVETLAAVIKKQQTLIWKEANQLDDQTIAEQSGLLNPPDPSKIPSLIGVNTWTPPWNPMYMAWQITWYPSYTKVSEALDDWTFDPTLLDYVWDDSKTVNENYGFTLDWYAILTPETTNVLEQKLNQYFAEHKEEYPDLENFLDNVAEWDFISQALGGFSEMLIGKDLKQLNPINDNDDLKSLVKDGDQYAPKPDLNNESPFMPIRAGHFRINKLKIVDDFGQVFDPIGDTKRSFGNYHPILGDGLIYSKDQTLIQLPPRLMQDFKLEFQLVDASDDDQIVPYNQGSNPVCGWILPNHLDNSITVYDTSGVLLGEMILTGGSQNRRLRWDSAPGSDQATVGTPLDQQIMNVHLYGFVNSLINHTDGNGDNNSAKAYDDFIKIIDETMWTVSPTGGRGSSNLSLLVGRPLALVRAKLNYDLAGGPIYNQSWETTTQNDTDGYLDLSFPIYLGNLVDKEDGLLGYYLGNDYESFNSIHQSDDQESNYVENKPVELTLNQESEWVSLLWDPIGHVNAITGVLPIQQLVLPDAFVGRALNKMEVTFRTGPLISDPDTIRMPLPAEINGEWSWIQHTGVTTWLETTDIEKSVTSPQLQNQNPVLKEGWLKLSDAIGLGSN